MGARALRLGEQLGGAGPEQPLGHRAAEAAGSAASSSTASRIHWLPSGRPT